MGRFPHRSFLGRGDKDDAQHVAWALEQTNMTSMSHRLLHTLSGGERQRAAERHLRLVLHDVNVLEAGVSEEL